MVFALTEASRIVTSGRTADVMWEAWHSLCTKNNFSAASFLGCLFTPLRRTKIHWYRCVKESEIPCELVWIGWRDCKTKSNSDREDESSQCIVLAKVINFRRFQSYQNLNHFYYSSKSSICSLFPQWRNFRLCFGRKLHFYALFTLTRSSFTQTHLTTNPYCWIRHDFSFLA